MYTVYSIHAFYSVSILGKLMKLEIRSKAGKLVQGHDAATSAVVIRDFWMPIWHLLAYITLTCGRDPASHSFVGIVGTVIKIPHPKFSML